MKKPLTFSCFTVLVILLASACGTPQPAPSPTPDVQVIFTQAAATIAAEYTQTALAIPTFTPSPSPTETFTPPPTFTPLPTQPVIAPTTPAPTAIYASAQTANGCYNAAWIDDVTVKPYSQFKPGEKFTKTWRLKNTGTCDWDGNFKIAYSSGEMLGSDTQKIYQNVKVGFNVDISLEMYAPNASGTVTSYWQMMTDDGKRFGPVLGITIVLPGGSGNPGVTVTPGGNACLQAAFVSASVGNGTRFNPGEAFTQVLTFQNTGSCDWNGAFKITFVGGKMLGFDTTKIRKTVRPGESISIALAMTAPAESGEHTSSWQLADDNGALFGPMATFIINVK
jgi:hypothetical protein